MRALMALAALCLAGCAESWMAGPSYTSSLSASDAPVVAASIARFVELRVKPDGGGVAVEDAVGDAAIGPAISADLSSAGYSVGPGGASRVRYVVQPLDQGMLTMAFLNEDVVATRIFERGADGQLHAGGPYAIREPATP